MTSDVTTGAQPQTTEVRFADFERSARVLYALEKGAADDDNGRGSVNWGITAHFLVLVNDKRKPSELSWEDAKELYKRYYWEPWKLGKIYEDRQSIADFIFASLVNTSPQHAVLAVQRALNGCGFNLKQDGAIGPITLHALNTCDVQLFAWNFYHFMHGWYEQLADVSKYVLNPKNGEHKITKPNARFLNGWISRLKYLHKFSGDPAPPSFVPDLSLYAPKDPRKK